MSKPYVKIGPIGLTAWQYEIIGCSLFYLIAGIGFFVGLCCPSKNPDLLGYEKLIWIPSALILLIGIFSPINVYLKEKAGYYDDPYRY